MLLRDPSQHSLERAGSTHERSEQCSAVLPVDQWRHLTCCRGPSRRGTHWATHLVILPESAVLKVWNWAILYCALYNYIIVPIQICSVQVQHSEPISILNWVRALMPRSRLPARRPPSSSQAPPKGGCMRPLSLRPCTARRPQRLLIARRNPGALTGGGRHLHTGHFHSLCDSVP